MNLPPDNGGPHRASRLTEQARSRSALGSTRRRPAALVEVIGLLVWFLLFTRLHAAAGRDMRSATANAETLQTIERALHVDVELLANRWLTEHPALIQPAVYYYRSYYVVVLGVLLWALFRHPGVYLRVRRTCVAMTILALSVFWALPMSPPRFALPGVLDVIAESDSLWGPATRDLGNGQNHFSAMPSLHVGWSLWCAYAVWCGLRVAHPRLALLAWVFPVGMTAVVLTTGNHYVLDVVGSAVLLSTSLGAAWVWGRGVDRWSKAAVASHGGGGGSCPTSSYVRNGLGGPLHHNLECLPGAGGRNREQAALAKQFARGLHRVHVGWGDLLGERHRPGGHPDHGHAEVGGCGGLLLEHLDGVPHPVPLPRTQDGASPQ